MQEGEEGVAVVPPPSSVGTEKEDATINSFFEDDVEDDGLGTDGGGAGDERSFDNFSSAETSPNTSTITDHHIEHTNGEDNNKQEDTTNSHHFDETPPHSELQQQQQHETLQSLEGGAEMPNTEGGEEGEGEGREEASKAEENSDDESKRAKEREGILKSIFGGDDDSSSGLSDMDVNDESGVDLEKRNKKKLDRILKKKQNKEKKERKKKRKKKKEAEGDEEKTSKKAKRKKGDKQERKRKRKLAASGDSIEVSEGSELPEDNASEPSSMGSQQEESPFDKALSNIKRRRRTKLDPIVADQKVGEFISKMEDCAEMDAENNRKGEPGLAKVKLLPEVVSMLSKVDLQPIFLDKGVLTAFRKWLEPLPDGSLPTFNIRRDLLNLLSKMPIKMDHLKPSGIGKAVMFLWKSPKELPDNKKVAHLLIQEWSRDIFELSTDYRNLADLEVKKVRQRIARPPSPKETEEREHLRDLDDVLRDSKGKIKPTVDRLHARIPQPAPLDYTKRPPRKSPELMSLEQVPQFQRTRSMEKKLANIKAKRKKTAITNQSRAVRMSITGGVK